MAGTIVQKAKEIRAAEDAYASAAAGPAPQSPSQIAEAARSHNLLNRDRGIFGTIQTGFRGLLEAATGNRKRKTLLGE